MPHVSCDYCCRVCSEDKAAILPKFVQLCSVYVFWSLVYRLPSLSGLNLVLFDQTGRALTDLGAPCSNFYAKNGIANRENEIGLEMK